MQTLIDQLADLFDKATQELQHKRMSLGADNTKTNLSVSTLSTIGIQDDERVLKAAIGSLADLAMSVCRRIGNPARAKAPARWCSDWPARPRRLRAAAGSALPR